VGADVKLQ
jgi:hypothetical protein